MIQYDNMQKDRQLIVGVGSALVDMLIHEQDAFLSDGNIPKGGMTYVDPQVIENLLSKATGRPVIVPGGSACNTMVGIGQLGGCCRFIGKLGNDELGDFFAESLLNNHIEPELIRSPSPTGRVLCIVTPDAQRSMLTFLGASSETNPEDVRSAWFEQAAVVQIEGYMLFIEGLVPKLFAEAKKAGALISFDLASFTVVESSKEILYDLVKDYVDILIANEDEARVFTGCSDETASLEALAKNADIAVLKLGGRGSRISCKGNVITVDPVPIPSTMDTTGAGDLWASGFLFGLVEGFSIQSCGKLASACGAEACRVMGAHIPDQGWRRIRQIVQSLKTEDSC